MTPTDTALAERNKHILKGEVYVMDLDENFVCLGIPHPTKCNFEVMHTNQIMLYATRQRLREIYEVLRLYYETKEHEANR